MWTDGDHSIWKGGETIKPRNDYPESRSGKPAANNRGFSLKIGAMERVVPGHALVSFP